MTATYDRCSKCGQFGWTGSHRCIPYQVKVLERIYENYPGDNNPHIESYLDEDWSSTVHSTEPRLAAETYTRNYDNGDYEVIGGKYKLRVLVFQYDPSEAEAKEFIVQGWTQPVYDASEQKERKYSFPAEVEDTDDEEEEDATISC